MLLLFWREAGLLIGDLVDLKWFHQLGYPPRCLLGGNLGASVANPYLNYSQQECAFAITGEVCRTTDVYEDKFLIGTTTLGIKQLDWASIKAQGCAVESPPDLSTSMGTFSTFNGLLSQDILVIEANQGYLGVLTSAGFCYGAAGATDYITYPTTSGRDCFVSPTGAAYLAEGNRLLIRYNPTDFATWDTTTTLGSIINDLWVTTRDGVETLFIATESGFVVQERGEVFSYGNSNYQQIKTEVGTTLYQGHVFACTADRVDIVNMRDKTSQESISFTGSIVIGVENKRLYSK